MSRASNVLVKLNELKEVEPLVDKKVEFIDIEFVDYEAHVSYNDGSGEKIRMIPVSSYDDSKTAEEIIKCF